MTSPPRRTSTNQAVTCWTLHDRHVLRAATNVDERQRREDRMFLVRVVGLDRQRERRRPTDVADVKAPEVALGVGDVGHVDEAGVEGPGRGRVGVQRVLEIVLAGIVPDVVTVVHRPVRDVEHVERRAGPDAAAVALGLDCRPEEAGAGDQAVGPGGALDLTDRRGAWTTC